jgi:hypothetical protein
MVTGDEGEGAMTRRITLVTAVLGLALAVPVASGQGQPIGSPQYHPIVSPDAVDRAIAAKESLQPAGRSLVFDDHRTDAAQQSTGRTLVFDDHRTDAAQQSTGRTLVFDNHRLDATRPEQVSVTSSGLEIEWPQVGLGLGLGIALALGLFLTFRYSSARPLAH